MKCQKRIKTVPKGGEKEMDAWNGNSEAFRTYFHGRIGEKNKSIPNEKVKDQPGHPWEEVCQILAQF